jgi:hypothetical protein
VHKRNPSCGFRQKLGFMESIQENQLFLFAHWSMVIGNMTSDILIIGRSTRLGVVSGWV